MSSTKMAKIGSLVAILLVLSTSLLPCLGDSDYVISYDDGESDYYWADFHPFGAAVKFTPLTLPWKVTAIRLYGFMIDREKTQFIVEIRDSDFNLIYKSSFMINEYFNNATVDWARIPLPNVTVDGDFYTCVYPMLEIGKTELWIGVDNDSSIVGRSYFVDCYEGKIVNGWNVSHVGPGNVMIKVEGIQAVSFTQVKIKSIIATKDGAGVDFRVLSNEEIVDVKAMALHNGISENCEVIQVNGTYRTRVGGLKPAWTTKLMIIAKTLNSTASITIEISGDFWSDYSKLREENDRLKSAANNATLELELKRFEDIIEQKNLIIADLKSSFRIYEERWLETITNAKQLNETTKNLKRELDDLNLQLNVFKIATVSFAAIMLLLAVVVLKRRSSNSTRIQYRKTVDTKRKVKR